MKEVNAVDLGFEVIFAQVGLMFALMLTGYFCAKAGMLGPSTSKDMTTILVTLVGPCLILKAFIKPFNPEEARSLFWCVVISFIYFVFMMALSKMVFSKRFARASVVRIQSQFALMYSNNGFIGVPLVLALFGERGVFFAAAQLAVSNGFIWSQGLGLFQKESGQKVSLLKVISNPNIVSLGVAMTFYLTGISLPGPAMQGIGYVAALNTPLSMMVVGAGMTALPFSAIINDKRVWQVVLMRLLLVPTLTLGLLVLIQPAGISALALVVIVIMSGCSVPAMTVMFSKLYNLDEAYPTKLVTLSTMLSVLSLPLVVHFAIQYFPI